MERAPGTRQRPTPPRRSPACPDRERDRSHPATVDQVACGQTPIRGESPARSRQTTKDLGTGPVTRNTTPEGTEHERPPSRSLLFSRGDRAHGTRARRDVSHGHRAMWLVCAVWQVCAGMPKLAARRMVMHNDSCVEGLASRHDEAPDGASRSGGIERMLNCSTGSQPVGRTLGGPPKLSGGRWALSRGDSQSPVAERPGGGTKTRTGAAPRRLRHPGPLTRGADRDVYGQHERPVDGPATGMAADPTAGCGVSSVGYGYPDHVGTFLLAKRVLGRLPDPHHKVRWPRGPSRLAQGRSTGPLFFLINDRDHSTVPRAVGMRPRTTCRVLQRRHRRDLHRFRPAQARWSSSTPGPLQLLSPVPW
ncbi:hypothetical protein SUDANB180_07740 (plasmid) [Streptomyces sp. enrichment culture]